MNNYKQAVIAADQTLQMYDEVMRLRAQVEELTEYRNKYIELLDSSISHSGHMMAGMLQIAMKPGVMDAIAKSNEAES